MTKSAIEHIPDFYKNYIELAPEGDLIKLLPEGGIKLYTDDIEKLMALGQKTYAEDKWTINQLVEHMMDTERLFLARANRFVRNDTTELPGYDHDQYVKNSRSNEIPLQKLIMQWIALRGATLATYSNFNDEELLRKGIANGQELSVLAIGYILIGHPIHHFNIIQERYYPLLTP